MPEGFPELRSHEQGVLRDGWVHLPVYKVLGPEARTRFMQLGANWPAHVQKAALNWAAELPAELLTWIEETCFYEDWQPPEWASDSIPLIRAAAAALEGQTFPCPHGLWERLRTLENWLAPGALLFLSDKGFYAFLYTPMNLPTKREV